MKILIAGDFCPCDRVKSAFELGEFDKVLGGVKPVVESADYSIVNFECPIVKGGETPISKVGPNLYCSERGLKAVKYAGFDCVTLANNHFYDYGDEGVKNTLAYCEKYAIDYVGGGNDIDEASKVLYKKTKGQTLAVVNCCENEFSIATKTTAGSNPLNPIQQYYAIKEARKFADRVLVIVHGGHEHFQLPSLRMVETYRFFIDAGADAVVNHHQHCYSGYELYQGKPIFYGLGNFCFDSPRHHSGIWTEGYVVMVDFDNDMPDFQLFPYKQCTDNPNIELLSQDAFNDKLNELNSIITDSSALQMAIDRYYQTCVNQYANLFEPIYNRYYFAAKLRGWLPSLISKNRKRFAENYIVCESHRDKMLFWLKNHQ